MASVKEKDRTLSKKVDLDTILIEELGQFGKYQARTVAMLGVVVLFIGWATSEYLFTTARIATRFVQQKLH